MSPSREVGDELFGGSSCDERYGQATLLLGTSDSKPDIIDCGDGTYGTVFFTPREDTAENCEINNPPILS